MTLIGSLFNRVKSLIPYVGSGCPFDVRKLCIIKLNTNNYFTFFRVKNLHPPGLRSSSDGNTGSS